MMNLKIVCPSVRANYAGLVTLVDTWFGRLVDTIDRLGLKDNTLIMFLSDHGYKLCKRILIKQQGNLLTSCILGRWIYRSLSGIHQVLVLGQSVRNLFIRWMFSATVMAASQVEPAGEIQGQSLLPLVEGKSGFNSREYLTCRYVNSVWYKDAKSWYFSSVDLNSGMRLFDLEADPTCQNNISDKGADRIALAHETALSRCRWKLAKL